MSDYKWIVHPFSHNERGSREISVIHESNFHGLRSHGWFDDRKIFIAKDSMYGTLNDDLAEVAIQIASNMAVELNRDSPVPQKEIDRAIESNKKRDEHLSEILKPANEAFWAAFKKCMEESHNND